MSPRAQGDEAAQHVGHAVGGGGILDKAELSAGLRTQVLHGQGLRIAGGAEADGGLFGGLNQVIQGLIGESWPPRCRSRTGRRRRDTWKLSGV